MRSDSRRVITGEVRLRETVTGEARLWETMTVVVRPELVVHPYDTQSGTDLGDPGRRITGTLFDGSSNMKRRSVLLRVG